MRKIKCFDIPGTSVESVLTEFNERRGEFAIEDEDIISISTRSTAHVVGSQAMNSNIVVTIFYWSGKP